VRNYLIKFDGLWTKGSCVCNFEQVLGKKMNFRIAACLQCLVSVGRWFRFFLSSHLDSVGSHCQ